MYTDHVQGAENQTNNDPVHSGSQFVLQTELYRLLTDQVPAVVWMTDHDLVIQYINGGAIGAAGINPNEAVGTPLAEFLGIPDPTAKPLPEHRRALDGERVQYELAWKGRTFQCRLEPMRSSGDTIVGTIGIANDITERVELESALRRRLAAESMMTEISTDFVSMQLEEIDTGISHALRRVGEHCDVDRAYVFQMSENGTVFSNTHEWCADGVTAQIDNLQRFATKDFQWWMSTLKQKEEIRIEQLADLPRHAVHERKVLEKQDIQSLLVLPLFAGGALLGFLGVDSVRSTVRWLAEDVSLLRTLSAIIAGALQRRSVELAVRDSRAVNRSLLEVVPDMVFRLDRRGVVLTCNVKEPEKLAVPLDRLLGSRIADVGLTDVAALYDQAIARVFESGGVQSFEYNAPPQRGSRWWEVRIVQCGPDEVIATVRDVTEHRRAESAIRERDRFLANLIGSLPGFVYRCRNDRKWTMQYVSEGVRNVLGYEAHELHGNVGVCVSDLIHADDRDMVWNEVQSALMQRRYFRLSYRIHTKSGATKWMLEQGGGVFRPDGTVEAVEGFVSDISELKEAEDSLRRNHAILRLTLNELDHRVRNNLAAISALLDITARRHDDVDQFRHAMKHRIESMAEVHSMLSRNRWAVAQLDQLVEAMIPQGLEGTVSIDGPAVHLSPRQATALGMVLHELIVNGLKYGALSEDSGRLDISWELHGIENEMQKVQFRWREQCTTPVHVANGQGLGTGLIEGIVRNDLRGRAALAYPPTGADHRIVLRLESVDSM